MHNIRDAGRILYLALFHLDPEAEHQVSVGNLNRSALNARGEAAPLPLLVVSPTPTQYLHPIAIHTDYWYRDKGSSVVQV